MAPQGVEELQDLAAKLAAKRANGGFAMRKRRHEPEPNAWRETVTHFLPEPWLIARRAAATRTASAEGH